MQRPKMPPAGTTLLVCLGVIMTAALLKASGTTPSLKMVPWNVTEGARRRKEGVAPASRAVRIAVRAPRQAQRGVSDGFPPCVWHTGTLRPATVGHVKRVGPTSSEAECDALVRRDEPSADLATRSADGATNAGECAAVFVSNAWHADHDAGHADQALFETVAAASLASPRSCLMVKRNLSDPFRECPGFPPAAKSVPTLATLLVLKFNFGHPEPACSVIELARRWNRVFVTVAVSGPFDDETAAAVRAAGIHAHVCLDDAGHYSPQETLLWAMALSTELKNSGGVLYMHDDMMIDVSRVPIWAGLNQPAASIATWMLKRPADLANIESAVRTGSSNRSDVRSLVDNWSWLTVAKFNRGGRGGGLPAMRASGTRWWSAGQVDIVYIPPAPYPTRFISDLERHLEHRVFSELALPSAVLASWSALTDLKLCTTWGADRDREFGVTMSEKCLAEPVPPHQPPYDAFHPIKRHMGSEWAGWDHMFTGLSATNPNHFVRWLGKDPAVQPEPARVSTSLALAPGAAASLVCKRAPPTAARPLQRTVGSLARAYPAVTLTPSQRRLRCAMAAGMGPTSR